MSSDDTGVSLPRCSFLPARSLPLTIVVSRDELPRIFAMPRSGSFLRYYGERRSARCVRSSLIPRDLIRSQWPTSLSTRSTLIEARCVDARAAFCVLRARITFAPFIATRVLRNLASRCYPRRESPFFSQRRSAKRRTARRSHSRSSYIQLISSFRAPWTHTCRSTRFSFRLMHSTPRDKQVRRRN